MSFFYPQEGSVYRRGGCLYEVLMVVLSAETNDYMVVYQPQDGTCPWVRPMKEFGEQYSYVSNVGWEPS
jgi:hypothetical protein